MLESEILDNKILDKYRVKFGSNVSFNTIFLSPNNSKNIIDIRYRRNVLIDENIIIDAIYKIFNLFTMHFKRNISTDKVNYVSPLRAFPKRYYFLDEANVSSSLDTIDGDNLTEILKQNKDLRKLVNEWLKVFNVTVNIEDLKDVIHKIKINQNGVSLDITDVGFGISQILPVIVQGFLSQENSITLIEQPEIHLHPKMQAQLADLFIDIIKTTQRNTKSLIIETHSEYLLKRLRRRIAEGSLSNEDVGLYFIHGREKKTGAAKIERIEITQTGAFNWPSEFYSTDFEDTSEFMKHQK